MAGVKSSGRIRVAVLMGGSSSERSVSLSSGRVILQSLDGRRYCSYAVDTCDVLRVATRERQAIGVPRPGQSPVRRDASITAAGRQAVGLANMEKPDVVVIALHGKGGEDGTIQGLLELAGLPYTGSGVLASALAMDKAVCKRVLRAEGIPVLDHIEIRRGREYDVNDILPAIDRELGGLPVFVKPNAEGSTFGCSLVRNRDALGPALDNALLYDNLALVETYAEGMEITVGVIAGADPAADEEALPPIEIVPRGEYYDYESKYDEGGSRHIIPARLPQSRCRQAQDIGLRCHRVLGCRGMSRTDMIVVGDALFVLEVNTIPGMTPTSLLPHAAAHAGITFTELLDRLIAVALDEV